MNCLFTYKEPQLPPDVVSVLAGAAHGTWQPGPVPAPSSSRALGGHQPRAASCSSLRMGTG